MDFGGILVLVDAERERERGQRITRRRLRDASDPMDLEEATFMNLYRINKEIALVLIQGVASDILRNNAGSLPVPIVVLTAVRFFAVGSYQRSIGQEYNLMLAQTTVSKCVKEVTHAIVQRLFHTYIKFPSTAAERRAVCSGFEDKHNLPDCLGCIDGTHISIVTPYNNNPDDPPTGYKNRKGNYTINTQFVCDSNCKLLNVNARFPGSTHDQHIFNNSIIKQELAHLTNSRIGKYYIIGDSGYAKEPFLITPILPTPPNGSAEQKYNHKIAKVRNCIERTNGIIKAVFRCLRKDRVLHYQPRAAAFIILSCCTIYNMMHHYRVPLPDPLQDEEVETNYNNADNIAYQGRTAALRRQSEIIEMINRHI